MPEEISGSSFLRMTGLGDAAKRQKRPVAGRMVTKVSLRAFGLHAHCLQMVLPPTAVRLPTG
jgi:hypothetical protein